MSIKIKSTSLVSILLFWVMVSFISIASPQTVSAGGWCAVRGSSEPVWSETVCTSGSFTAQGGVAEQGAVGCVGASVSEAAPAEDDLQIVFLCGNDWVDDGSVRAYAAGAQGLTFDDFIQPRIICGTDAGINAVTFLNSVVFSCNDGNQVQYSGNVPTAQDIREEEQAAAEAESESATDPDASDDASTGEIGEAEASGTLVVGESNVKCEKDSNGVRTDDSNPIFCRFIEIINFLSVGVGIVATISVAIAGVQYTLSRGEPAKTAAAVNRIIQVGVAIFLYVFGWAMLNWLVPGGVL